MKRRGLTLLELMLVLAILVAIAGIAVPMVSQLISGPAFRTPAGEKSAPRIATETTMLRIREAILGAGGNPGYYADMQELPQFVEDLFVRPSGAGDFDPATKRGWRGPYLLAETGRYALAPAAGFTAVYENGNPADGNPAALDGWGNPLVIQHPSSGDPDYARLVSAGPDRVLSTPLSQDVPSRAACGDDLVVYLRITDPRL